MEEQGKLDLKEQVAAGDGGAGDSWRWRSRGQLEVKEQGAAGGGGAGGGGAGGSLM